MAERRGGSVSRAVGAAALAALALLCLRYVAVELLALLGPGAGRLAAAAALVAAGLWLAAPLGRRLGADRPSPDPQPWLGGLVAGLAGAVAVALLLLGSLAARYRGFPAVGGPALLEGAALAAALGYAEEAFLRGAAFGILERRSGVNLAIWGSAALLALVGVVSGMGPVTGLTTFALGVWWGMSRARTGGYAAAAAAHAAWNVALGPVLGLGGEVAGGLGRSLFVAHVGAPWWAGPPGAVEGGLATLLVACAAAAGAYARWRGAPRPGG